MGKIINLVKIADEVKIYALRDEVFLWAIASSIASGFCKSKDEAVLLFTQRILRVFTDMPTKQHCFNITLNDQEIIGKVWLMERGPDEMGKSDLRISFIGLDENHQRKGYAADVFQLIEKYALEINYTVLSLNVFSHLPHAKKLYEKIGFIVMNEVSDGEKLLTSEMAKKIY